MHGPPDEGTAPKGASRTAAAVRQLLRALGHDIAGFFKSFKSFKTSLKPRRPAGRAVARFAAWSLVLASIAGLAMFGGMIWMLQQLPAAKRADAIAAPALLLEAHNGEPLGRIGPLKFPDAAREDFPQHVIDAVLSIEDHRFYRHFGVDPIAIARALYRNLWAGEIVEGGSTITQQLMKLTYLGDDRSYARKLREAAMATAFEMRHSKDEILTEYLNTVYVGGGAYGIPAAARLYFAKTPSELTLSEAAMLAGLIRSPSRLNPIADLAAAGARAATVIDAMRTHGMIDEEAASRAKAHPATPEPPVDAAQARSWFTDWASSQATDLANIHAQNLRVRTTLMPELQRLAEQVVNDALAEHGAGLDASQAALVAMLPSGAVVAMVGGDDYEKSQFNRAAEADRHAGSAFKLFVYLAALREGYAPDDVIDAGPVSIDGWSPENYDGRNLGGVTLAEGFSRSINTAAVNLAMKVGLEKVIAAARDLGIDAPLKPFPSLALGAAGVSLVDLTGAYASVRAGRRVEPWGIAGFRAGDEAGLRAVGGVLADGKRLGPERDAMIALLRGVVERGTGRKAALDGFAAGKTGTSQDYRDAWFIGFTEPLVVGVWVGNDDNSPMKRVTGGSLPAMIWHRFMAESTRIIEQEQLPVVARSTAIPGLPQSASAHESEHAMNAEVEPRSGDEDDADVPSALRAGETMSKPQAGACNVAACADAYRSFRASDCTYQPYDGPRQVCTRGASGEGANTAAADGEREGQAALPRVIRPPHGAVQRVIRPPERVIRRVFQFVR